MSNRTIIPFGPQHPVLPEPIHLDLVVEDEKVVEAIPSIGYIHRGLEKLVEKKDFIDYVFVAERICGICSFTHGMAYSQGIEALMKMEIPPRAVYLRMFWSELSRMHSHLLWLGLMADSFGFESLFMHTWRLREKIVDIAEETTGGRVIWASCKVGGVRRDIENGRFRAIVKDLVDFKKELRSVLDVFLKDSSVKHRTVGVGVVTKENAYKLGAVGPTLRGSGVAEDARMLGYAAYKELDFSPIVDMAGDCYARTKVRVLEIYQAIDLIRQIGGKIPDGPIDVKVTGTPNGEFFSRAEQPRGEVIYYAKGNGTKFLDRLRVRTPTFANIAPLITMLPGSDLADVPVLVLSIDPCISCTER